MRHTWPKWRASGGDGSPNPGIVNPSFLRVLIPTRVGGSIKIVVIHFTPFKKGQSVIKSSKSFLLLFFFFQRLFINLPNHRPRLRAFKAPLSLFLSLSSASFDIIRMKRSIDKRSMNGMNRSKKRRNKVSNKKRRFLFYADRCVEEWIRDRWVCCLFGSGARSCVKMKGETRATRPDERTRETNEE